MQLTIHFKALSDDKTPIECKHEIEIREVSGASAPVALVGTPRRPPGGNYIAPVEYRAYGGKLWTKIRVSGGVPHEYHHAGVDYAMLPFDVTESGERAVTLFVHPSFDMVEAHYQFGISSDGFCTWTDEHSNASALDTWATTNLLIDGVLHRPAMEPVYAVTLQANSRVIIKVAEHLDRLSQDALFPVTELAAAQRYASRMATERRDVLDQGARDEPDVLYTVVDPDALTFRRDPSPVLIAPSDSQAYRVVPYPAAGTIGWRVVLGTTVVADVGQLGEATAKFVAGALNNAPHPDTGAAVFDGRR